MTACQTDSRTWRLLTSTGAIAFWLVAWQLASMAVGSGLILAGPVDTSAALLRLLPSPAFWGHVGFSAARIIGGTLAGYVCAFALAALAWRTPVARTLLHPALSAIKGTPVACVVVLLLIWIGSRNVSAIAVFLLVLPGVYFPVLTGLDELDAKQCELFDVFGAGHLTRLLALVWPGILPYMTAASSTVLGMSWKAGVAAELIGVPTGSIGERIYQAKLLLETADLFAWTIVVVLLSWAFERAALAVLRTSWPAAGRFAARLASHADGMRHREAVLRTQDLSVGYNGKAVCAPLSFELPAGGILCLDAPSGTGKTTLLRTIAGLQTPVSSELAAPNRPTPTVFQETRLVEDLSAVENLLLLARGLTVSDAESLLGELLPVDILAVPVRELSGGQRRRVELTRAFAAPANLILLDEPFTGLDAETHREALAFIQRHQAGKALMIATHNPTDADALGATVLTLQTTR